MHSDLTELLTYLTEQEIAEIIKHQATIDTFCTGLHEAQREIVWSSRRFNVVNCGRRFGKTVLGINRAIQAIQQGAPVGWFAPTYKLMLDVWNEIRKVASDVNAQVSKAEHRMTFPSNGIIDFWSLDNPDAGRGRKYARIIVDEAAMVKNLMDAWTASIRPTLTDLKGDAWFLSTPKGHNGFWELYQFGLDPLQRDWACWRLPTSTNLYIDEAEIEAARLMLPERAFQQEYLADFIEDGSGIFRKVRQAATAKLEQQPVNNPTVMGCDWGKHNDFTVLTVIDLNRNELVAMERFNQIDYAVQIGRLKVLADRWKPLAIVAERNSIGEPIIEQMLRDGLPVQPFTTTNATKQAIIEGLSLAFEREQIKILPNERLIAELQAYEVERLPSGLLRYGAPEGMHDDCVISLALAWYGASSNGGNGLLESAFAWN